MATATAKPPPQRRQSSRPNSASSSSVVTIQHAPSFSSRTGSKPPITGLRSQSPYESNATHSTSSAQTLSPETTKRRSSAFYIRPESGHGFREGVGNLNRWSQSTVSSKGSASHNRRSSFSKRLSGSLGSFGGFGERQNQSPNAILATKGRSPSKLSPPEVSNVANPPASQLPILPPIVTLTSLSQAVDAADSPSTATSVTPVTADILTPSTYKQPDYFGDNWKSKPPTMLTTGMKRPAPSAAPRPNIISTDQSTSPGTPSPESMYSPRTAARLRHTDRRRSPQTTYQRSRADSSRGSKSSGTVEGESSASDHRARIERPQKRKAPSQKAMLSKALQKAHHAVTLDQHSNYEGAMHAYQEACSLLQKVMIRSSGVEDRMKLDAVRNTYEARIMELRSSEQAYQSADGKALPEPPQDRDSRDSERLSIVTDTDESEAVIGTATMTPLGHGQNGQAYKARQTHVGMMAHAPPRRQSLHQTSPYKVEGQDIRSSSQEQSHQNGHIDSHGVGGVNTAAHLNIPTYQDDMPPPLSPRRPLSPDLPVSRDTTQSSAEPSTRSALSDEPNESDSFHQDNEQHTSWLNTINESSGSSSSVHSRRSSIGLRRKHIRADSGQTEAEFNAALDEALETAYDDGFEPDDEEDDDEQLLNDPQYQYGGPRALTQAARVAALAEDNMREAERATAIAQARESEKQLLKGERDGVGAPYGNDEDEEEERMLEEMTRDYILDDTEYDIQTKSALPRQSNSSGFSGRTWGSSIGSNPTSAGTSLSIVPEAPSLATQLQDNPLPPPLHPPPSSALPPPPAPPPPKGAPPSVPQSPNTGVQRPASLIARNTSPGVRERRLSGTKRKPLKIDTNTKPSNVSGMEAPKTQPPPVPPTSVLDSAADEVPQSARPAPESQQTLPSLAFKATPPSATFPNSRKGSSPMPGSDSTDVTSSTASALTKVTSADSDNSIPSIPPSPGRFGSKAAKGLRKNISSSSLRKQSLMVSVPDPADNASNVSLSSMSSTPKQGKAPSPAVPVLPTPIDTSFIAKGQPMGGISLFDSDIHSPDTPGSPNPQASNAPLPLEPCPESTLLRPFWFLRCIYQTIAHPRGGYISTRLFVPRDIWRVKNIKLRNVEEKVSSCDLLTAALLKLGKVDTLDAAAVLEEMQFFETVMEQVQSTLTKKLGSEVGVQGASQVLKNVSTFDDNSAVFEPMVPKASNANTKYLSWRKLRSRNFQAPGTQPGVTTTAKDGPKEASIMKSLPMTTKENPRFPKRNVNQIQCVGPNPSYMGALARLCDAAQILDQISRQVEDPGLKHSSQTHVGLELSARHAAEFFAFFICRFVLTDIGMMLDKFIKRGSEWILA